jgi:hypothetical protein
VCVCQLNCKEINFKILNPTGASPSVTIKEAKHMKILLFYGRADGKDEVSAEDLIDRIEALCKGKGKGDDVKIQEPIPSP